MRKIALGFVLTALISTPAWAEPSGSTLNLTGALRGVTFNTVATTTTTAAAVQGPDDAPPVTALVGADFPSTYFFRGYRQENEPALTFQPYVDVAFAGESASFNVGSWNSFHTGDQVGFYETDFYAAVTTGLLKTTYTAYMYPEFDDSTIHELMFSATFPHMLAPSFALAFELAKPEGLDKGIYLELGVAPAIPLGDDAPVSITIPVKFGLSLKDYYGEDTFGYFSAGLTLGHSITDALEVHAGFTGYGFGDVLKTVNKDNAGQFVGSAGLSFKF